MTKQMKLMHCIFFGAYFFAPTLLFATEKGQLISRAPSSVSQEVTAKISNKPSIRSQSLEGKAVLEEPFNDQDVTLSRLGNTYNFRINQLVFMGQNNPLTAHVLTQHTETDRQIYIEALFCGQGNAEAVQACLADKHKESKNSKVLFETRNGAEYLCDFEFIEMNAHYRNLLEGQEAFAHGRLAQKVEELLEAVALYDEPNTPLGEMFRLLPAIMQKIRISSKVLLEQLETASSGTLRVLNAFVEDCDRYIQNRTGPMTGKNFSDILPLDSETPSKVAVERVSITNLIEMMKGIYSITSSIKTGHFTLDELTRFLREVNNLDPSKGGHTANIIKLSEPFKKYPEIFKRMHTRFKLDSENINFQDFRTGIILIIDFMRDIEQYIIFANRVMAVESTKKQLSILQTEPAPLESTALVHKPSEPYEFEPYEVEHLVHREAAVIQEMSQAQSAYYLHIQQAKKYLGQPFDESALVKYNANT